MLPCLNPTDDSKLCTVKESTKEDYEICVKSMEKIQEKWSMCPMPKRGQIIMEIGEEMRKIKKNLCELLTLETGKMLSESC